jgi:hypothetical protein
MTEKTIKTAKTKPLSPFQLQQNKIDELERQMSFLRTQMLQMNMFMIKSNNPATEIVDAGLTVVYRQTS